MAAKKRRRLKGPSTPQTMEPQPEQPNPEMSQQVAQATQQSGAHVDWDQQQAATPGAQDTTVPKKHPVDISDLTVPYPSPDSQPGQPPTLEEIKETQKKAVRAAKNQTQMEQKSPTAQSNPESSDTAPDLRLVPPLEEDSVLPELPTPDFASVPVQVEEPAQASLPPVVLTPNMEAYLAQLLQNPALCQSMIRQVFGQTNIALENQPADVLTDMTNNYAALLADPSFIRAIVAKMVERLPHWSDEKIVQTAIVMIAWSAFSATFLPIQE